MKHYIPYICALALFFQGAAVSAYVTTEQHSFTTDGKTGWFVVDFEFGHGKHEVYIPALAKRGGEATDAAVTYEIREGKEAALGGSAVGLILSSDAPYRDGFYVIPKGVRAHFSLLGIFTPVTPGRFTLAVTDLPFQFDGEDTLRLNPSELQYYLTPGLTLPPLEIAGIEIKTSDGREVRITSESEVEFTIAK